MNGEVGGQDGRVVDEDIHWAKVTFDIAPKLSHCLVVRHINLQPTPEKREFIHVADKKMLIRFRWCHPE
uniref:Uncharacterized protein n=1 Tax=Anopheles albimanus TaxID=7167 RepID=A0A182F7B1_ANOAL